jgi:hypothetical protein
MPPRAASPRGGAADAAASAASGPPSSAAAASLPRLPAAWPPPFTLADLRAAVPAHCFERSALRSLGHVALDLALVGALGYGASWIGALPAVARPLLWLAYWYAAGSVMTGLWVLAHECGHGGFSDSQLLNDAVGWTLHSLLLVPYFSWKYTCVERTALLRARRRRRCCARITRRLPPPPWRRPLSSAAAQPRGAPQEHQQLRE